MTLHEDFIIWAEENGINLKEHDDYSMWYRCWSNGFNSAIELYSQWRDGERYIGAMQSNIKDILRSEGNVDI